VGSISFSPTFSHVDFVDRQDRVRAGGGNGFNSRFNAIQADLLQLSTVVGQIDAALDQLGTSTPVERTLAFTPMFRFVPPHLGAWFNGADGAAQAHVNADLYGVMSLAPPDGVRLTSMRVVGSVSLVTSPEPGQVDINLQRAAVPRSGPDATLAGVSLAGQRSIDLRSDVPPDLQVVDLRAFRYYLAGSGFNIGVPNSVFIQAVYLTYLTS
jgi:hypothetical protein